MCRNLTHAETMCYREEISYCDDYMRGLQIEYLQYGTYYIQLLIAIGKYQYIHIDHIFNCT